MYTKDISTTLLYNSKVPATYSTPYTPTYSTQYTMHISAKLLAMYTRNHKLITTRHLRFIPRRCGFNSWPHIRADPYTPIVKSSHPSPSHTYVSHPFTHTSSYQHPSGAPLNTHYRLTMLQQCLCAVAANTCLSMALLYQLQL